MEHVSKIDIAGESLALRSIFEPEKERRLVD